jgi:hypothetical protein
MNGHRLEQTPDRARLIDYPPVRIALAISILGVLTMLVVDFGPWSHPQIQPAEVAIYRTTGEAARAAGAVVTPTQPKRAIEPVAPGPKPIQPANPDTP